MRNRTPARRWRPGPARRWRHRQVMRWWFQLTRHRPHRRCRRARRWPERVDDTLAARLRAAGIEPSVLFGPGMGPWEAWLRLRQHWGPRATLVDLYTLEAASRGIPASALPPADRARLTAAARPVTYPGRGPVPRGAARPGDQHEVTSYDPAWPAQFGAWRDRLDTALGAAATRIAHVGSTAVPGLAAKPVVDIQVSVRDVADEEGYLAAAESPGLILRMREPGHLLLWPPAGTSRCVHVHVCGAGGAWERDHLLFRDYLRAHAAVRADYGALKRELIRQWRDDRKAYTEAKTGFVLDVLDDARRWADETGWRVPPP